MPNLRSEPMTAKRLAEIESRWAMASGLYSTGTEEVDAREVRELIAEVRRLSGPKRDWTAELILPDRGRVYDGDTYWVYTRGFYRQIHYVEIRLAGWDTPELKSKDPRERGQAAAAREYVEHWLRRYVRPIYVTTLSEDTEKYGRWLGRLRDDNGSDLGEGLAAEGLAVPYDGTSKTPKWRDVYLKAS